MSMAKLFRLIIDASLPESVTAKCAGMYMRLSRPHGAWPRGHCTISVLGEHPLSCRWSLRRPAHRGGGGGGDKKAAIARGASRPFKYAARYLPRSAETDLRNERLW